MSSRPPSFHDLLDEVTESHRIESDPPFTRWVDRRIGRVLRLGVRWIITTKGGTALVAAATAFLTWLSHHLTHWMDRF